MEKKVGMLGVTEKSFGHLSGRYDVAGGTIGGGSTGSSPAQVVDEGELGACLASHILQVR